MVIENCSVDPVMVPDTDPVPTAPVLVSVARTVPENDASVCVSCHVICPGPEESDAEPLHDPLRFTGEAGVGEGCVVPPLLPPQETVQTTRAASADTRPKDRGAYRAILTGFDVTSEVEACKGRSRLFVETARVR